MNTTWPNAIVIDKDKTSRMTKTKEIHAGVWTWQNGEIGGTQIACDLLLYWFHAKKVWVYHFLLKLREIERGNLYKAMCAMLEARHQIVFKKHAKTSK